MAKLTSHTLNGFNGTHAGGIVVRLYETPSGREIFRAEMDEGGRLTQEINSTDINTQAMYELIFLTGPYWASLGLESKINEIALRFQMDDPNGHYHMPIIINPNSYSTWMSS